MDVLKQKQLATRSGPAMTETDIVSENTFKSARISAGLQVEKVKVTSL